MPQPGTSSTTPQGIPDICLCLPPDRTWHKVNDPKVDYSGGYRGGEGRARAEAWALFEYAGHRPTLYNVGLMRLVGLGPKSGARHVCLVTAQTGQQGPVLYKGDKSVNVAARPPEGGPSEDRRPFGIKFTMEH